VAAAFSAPVIGAGTLIPTRLVILHTDVPLGLLSLTAGDVIAAGTRIFATDPVSVVLPFTARILTIDPQSNTVSVMEADAYTLVLPVAEAQLSRVVIGDTADVQFDALPGQTFVAEVSAIAPLVTLGRGTVNVSLILQSPPETLRPNMAARINLCGCHSDLRLSENG
jgi:multidrug efflux pump subunit AcrA (membrane-fusion protein)